MCLYCPLLRSMIHLMGRESADKPRDTAFYVCTGNNIKPLS